METLWFGLIGRFGRVGIPAVLLFASAAMAGCQPEDGDDSECKSGKTHSCTCPDGSEGVHECGEDGMWDSCDCSGGGGAGGAGEEGTYQCGGETCPAPQDLDVSGISIGGGMVEEISLDDLVAVGVQRKPDGCCIEGEDKCGLIHPQLTVDGVCREIDQQGRLAAECPSEQLSYPIPMLGIDVPVTYEGCCRFNNTCGLMLDRMHLGCVERLSFVSRDLQAIPCTY